MPLAAWWCSPTELKSWRDLLGNRQDEVITDELGQATFPVNGGSVSVWVLAETL